jgi:hypothetical protein
MRHGTSVRHRTRQLRSHSLKQSPLVSTVSKTAVLSSFPYEDFLTATRDWECRKIIILLHQFWKFSLFLVNIDVCSLQLSRKEQFCSTINKYLTGKEFQATKVISTFWVLWICQLPYIKMWYCGWLQDEWLFMWLRNLGFHTWKNS